MDATASPPPREPLDDAIGPLFTGQPLAMHTPRRSPPPARHARPALTPHALSLCNLGSGSGGNCTALRLDPARPDAPHLVLLDAGFGPRTTAQRLAQAGHTLGDVAALCLPHLDRDHFKPSWIPTLLGLQIRVVCDRWHADKLLRMPAGPDLRRQGLLQPIDTAGPALILDLPDGRALTLATHRCQHDRQGTVAYRLDAPHAHAAIAYATDLGHVPAGLIELFAGVGLLCLEANYDERMTTQSARPSFVNRRNLSDSGHLSNEQALDAARAIADRCPAGGPARILLMHRSSQCNHPTKLRRVFDADPALARRITLTEQRRRTRWFRVPPRPAVLREQLLLGV
jgi:hypothetical protein